jgi:hypothetical protein
MKRFRLHLGTLVMLVLILGVGFAALRESNETWDSIIFSMTLGVLFISVLLAVHRTGQRRVFWLGFALFGSAYLGFSLVPSIEPRLITTKTLTFLDSKMPRSIPASVALYDIRIVKNSQPIALQVNKGNGTVSDVNVVAGSKPWFPNLLAGQSLTGSSGTTDSFVRIGHSFLALIAAIVGGQIFPFYYLKNCEQVSASVHPQA